MFRIKIKHMSGKIYELTQDELDNAINMLKAIAHPLRLSIISNLEDGKILSVTQIHKKLEIEQSTASHHLSILKDKGILGSKRKGKNTFYYLKHENLTNLVDCIKSCAKHS